MSDSSEDEAFRAAKEAAKKAKKSEKKNKRKQAEESDQSGEEEPSPKSPREEEKLSKKDKKKRREENEAEDADEGSSPKAEKKKDKKAKVRARAVSDDSHSEAEEGNASDSDDGKDKKKSKKEKEKEKKAKAKEEEQVERKRLEEEREEKDRQEKLETEKRKQVEEARILEEKRRKEEIERFLPSKTFSGYLEKSAKYSKKWVKRWVVLHDRDVSYGLSEGVATKHTLEILKVTRGGELKLDPHSLSLDCEDEQKKPFVLLLRCADREEFNLWYRRFVGALAYYKMMDPINEGIPETHPKTHLKFVDIPLDMLATFGPLDRLLLHFFAVVQMRLKSHGLDTTTKQVVFIGDRMLYTCKIDANISRCIPMPDIAKVLWTEKEGESTRTLGIQCSMPEYDLMFSLPKETAEEFMSVFTPMHGLYGGLGIGKKIPYEKVESVEQLQSQLQLVPNEFYSLQITLPMSKKYLKKMMNEWIKKTGVPSATDGPVASPLAKNKFLAGGANLPEETNPIMSSPLAGLNKTASPTSASPNNKSMTSPLSPTPFSPAKSRQGAGPKGKIVIGPGIDKMHRLFNYLGIPQYYQQLIEKGMDWDVLVCMTPDDMLNKGIYNAEHRQMIEDALNNQSIMDALKVNVAPDAPPVPSSTSSPKGPPVSTNVGKNGPGGGDKLAQTFSASSASKASKLDSMKAELNEIVSSTGEKGKKIIVDDEDL